MNFLAGVKEAGLSHWWCSRASIFSFVRVVLFSSSHTYAAVCMVFYTLFQDLDVQRKMICCGCIQCLVWNLLSENTLALGLQHESSDMLGIKSIKMWLTQFLAPLNFDN